MLDSTARTILHLQDQRDEAEAAKRQTLLQLAEMKHELQMLRHMKREIVNCLTSRKLRLSAGYWVRQQSPCR